MKGLLIVNLIIGVIFVLCYGYQLAYIFIAYLKKDKPLPEITDEEIPFEIPTSWKWVRIQDLFNVRSAMRIHQTDWQSSGIPFFRGRELVQLVKTGTVDFEI